VTGRGRTSAALLALALLAAARTAHADCPEETPQAACVLHEEGVAALTAKRHEQAATKFRAAITAAPSARSYLGYSQAVEGQGKLALAYETMLVAQRLSNEEMAGAGAKDPVKIGRAERIKYKLSELGGRVGFVWLRLPEGVPPQRLVSIYREGEGDLPSPLGRWVTVAPDPQLLVATLDDGSQVQIIAKVAAGSQSSLVIPIAAPRQPPPPPVAQQRSSLFQPPPPQPRPIHALYQPRPPPPPRPLPSASLTAGISLLAPGPKLGSSSLGNGVGLFGLFERRAGKSLGLAFRADYVSHAGSDDLATSLSGYELLLLTGLRTMTRTLHARFEAGVSVSSVDAETFSPGGPVSVSRTDAYPLFGLGLGLHFGRVRTHASFLFAANPGGEAPRMPIRFMVVLGIDFWRR
jgi:hypothetical protein